MAKRLFDELVTEAIEMLENNGELFAEVCESLDNYNGFLNDDRLYNMDDFNDFMYGLKASEVIDKICWGSFDYRDNYFYYTIYGIESTDTEPSEYYKDVTSAGEVFDNLRDYYNQIDLEYINGELFDLLEAIDNYSEDEDGESLTA